MASTYSTSLRLELIGQGEQSGTWGITTNNNFGALVEQAITGVQTISMANASYTLTNFNGTVDEARNAVLVIAGTNLAPQNVVAPSVEKVYIINNKSGNTVTVKTSAGNGVAVSNNTTVQVYCDGTNFFSATPNINSVTGNFAATGTITSGGAMTSGGLLTAPTLSVTTSGSVGTNFSVAGTTYTGALVNYGNQQVNGSENITGNLTVGGTITGSIAGLTGIIKQIVSSPYYVSAQTNSSSYVPTGHIQSISPTSASSKIIVLFWSSLNYYAQYVGPECYAQCTMYRNGVAIGGYGTTSVGAVGNGGGAVLIAVNGHTSSFSLVDSPNTTGLVQYQPYINALGGVTAYYNTAGSGATITLIEVSQ